MHYCYRLLLTISYYYLNSVGSGNQFSRDLVELPLHRQVDMRCPPLHNKASNQGFINHRHNLHVSRTAEFLELLSDQKLLLLLQLHCRSKGGDHGIGQLAVLGLKGIADFRNSVNAVLIDEQVQEVDGVLVETALGSHTLDQILLPGLGEGGVGQEVLDVGVVLHDRAEGVNVGVDGLQGALGLGKVDQGVGVRCANGLIGELQRGVGGWGGGYVR